MNDTNDEERDESVELSIDQRSILLRQEIAKYIRRGYRVMSRTALSARLVKPDPTDRHLLFPSPEQEVTLWVDPVGRISRG